MGCVLTVLFGLLISMISDTIAQTQISSLTNVTADGEKPPSPAVAPSQHTADSFVSKESAQAIYFVEKYRKTSQQHLHSNRNLKGYDNPAMKMEEA